MAKTQKHELEKTLQARCIRCLRDHDVFFFKTIATSPAGIPDLCLLHEKSGAVFFEFKSQNGRLTALQSAQIARIEATQSARVFVVKDYENFIEIIKNLNIL